MPPSSSSPWPCTATAAGIAWSAPTSPRATPPAARHWPCSMQPIASSATGFSCGRAGSCPGVCLSSPQLPRIAYPNAPRTGLRARPGRGIRFFRRSGVRVMRFLLLPLLAVLVACGGHRPPAAVAPSSPVRSGARPADPKSADQPPAPSSALDQALLLPPAPELDTLVPAEELAAELRLAADSAADEAVLEALDDARPSEDDTDDALPATPVSWDIDVDTYHDHDRVQYYLDFFQGKGRERMGIWLTRMPRYEEMIRSRLQEQGLPGDLVYLALIESGFSNSATSRARAVGMWQFMKGTAKGYGLRVDSWVDERRDPYRATAAAAKHLRQLSDRFGSLYLAAAAYNAGAGKVSRGMRRLPDDDADSLTSDATFFRLYDTKLLRRETKDYVPKLIAAARIAKEPSRYGFAVGPAEPA